MMIKKPGEQIREFFRTADCNRERYYATLGTVVSHDRGHTWHMRTKRRTTGTTWKRLKETPPEVRLELLLLGIN